MTYSNSIYCSERLKNDPEWAEKRRAKGRKWYQDNKEQVKNKNGKYRIEQRANPELWVKQALYISKYRSAKKNIPFDLIPEDIEVTLVCPVLGFKLEYGGGKNNDKGPSLDRFIPSLGYTKGNVRIISNRANTLKRDGTVSEMRKILKYMESF